MAWDSGNTVNGYAIYKETLTWVSSDSAGQDLTSSEISFIPPGSDFVVFANAGSTNMSSDADLAVYAGFASGGTFGLLKDDLIAGASAFDAKMGSAIYDISLFGEAPYYKLFVDSDGVQKKTDTIQLVIAVKL